MSSCDFSRRFVADSQRSMLAITTYSLTQLLIKGKGRSAPPRRNVAELRCPTEQVPLRAARVDRRRPSKSCLTVATG